LESVAVLPQLLLLRQTTVPTVIDSYYLAFLGSYRAFYILNWIVRVAEKGPGRFFDPISTMFGLVQTGLYIDFAWVYYSRQRVKLRNGGIVDSDDLERGWLVGRLVGKHPTAGDEHADEDEANPVVKPTRWGRRGISVSADEGLDENAEDAQPLADPAAFEDELTDDESPPPKAQRHHNELDSPWRDEDSR
jgi:ER lumen protein retaining receptor